MTESDECNATNRCSMSCSRSTISASASRSWDLSPVFETGPTLDHALSLVRSFQSFQAMARAPTSKHTSGRAAESGPRHCVCRLRSLQDQSEGGGDGVRGHVIPVSADRFLDT